MKEMEAVREKKKICVEDKAQCEQLHCIGQDFFLAPPPVSTITQTQPENHNKANLFLFCGPQYNSLRGKVNRRFHWMAVMVVMVWC